MDFSLTYFLEVVGVGFILSADSFSAAFAMGSRPFSKKDSLRFAASSGGAEALVALAGALAGSQVISRFESIDHWVAFGLLAAVALHMGYEGLRDLMNPEDRQETLDFHSFTKVLVVSFATSLDAFGVGIGLGVSGKPLLPYVISIGFWAFASTLVGLHLAKRLSRKLGPVMNLFGAVVLMVIAIQMLKI